MWAQTYGVRCQCIYQQLETGQSLPDVFKCKNAGITGEPSAAADDGDIPQTGTYPLGGLAKRIGRKRVGNQMAET